MGSGAANLGHEVARGTVQAILREQGIESAPERSKRTSWKTFLRSHWDAIAACDFFTGEVLTFAGLTRCYVFFVIELATRLPPSSPNLNAYAERFPSIVASGACGA